MELVVATAAAEAKSRLRRNVIVELCCFFVCSWCYYGINNRDVLMVITRVIVSILDSGAKRPTRHFVVLNRVWVLIVKYIFFEGYLLLAPKCRVGAGAREVSR